MKHWPLPLLLFLATSASPADARKRFGLTDEWSRTEFSPSAGRKPFGETLALYSKNAKANVFADVTGLSTTTQVDSPLEFVAPRSQMPRALALARISYQMQMCYDRSAVDTYTLWPRPDFDKLTHLIVAEQQNLDATSPVEGRVTTIKALREFYIREKGWSSKNDTVADKNQRSQGVEGAIRFKDLPANLHDSVVAEFIRQVRLVGNVYGYGPVAWADDYWKEARVILRLPLKTSKEKGARPSIMVVAPPEVGHDNNFFLGVPMQVKVSGRFSPLPHAVLKAASPHHRPLCAPVETPELTEATQKDVELPSGFKFDPTQETILQKTVALSHEVVAPSQVVADLTKQGGIALELSPDVAPQSQMIAFSDGMPLWSAMAAVARIYNGYWEKTADGYKLVPDHLNELHTLMSRMGQYAYYRFMPHSREEALEIGSDLSTQIVDACGEEQLRTTENGLEMGVALSNLPSDLQKQVVALIREQNVGELIVSQQRVEDALAQDVKLRFSPKPKNTPQFFGADFTGGGNLNDSGGNAILTAYTTDGRFITQLFPEVSVPKANTYDEWLEKSRKEMEEFRAQHPLPQDTPQ